MRKKRTYNCPNPSCKKTFEKPLKTLNLQQALAEPYYACPYCLTEIIEEEIEIENKPEKAQVEKSFTKERPIKNKEKPISCQHHFGYLGERENREQFPDECMICTQIVDCMLAKTR
jgi:hypothetical protein